MKTRNLLTFEVMSKAKTSEEVRRDFGRFITNQRESKGLTQKYVAKQIGITVTQLSRIENGKSGTERDTVIAWAKIVGVDENEALRHYKPENELKYIAHSDILRDIEKVPDDRIESVRDIIQAAIQANLIRNNRDYIGEKE